MPTMKLKLLEELIDGAAARYKRTGELADLSELREAIKEHRALRGIPYEAP
ncbi:MAG: hypothetical protein PHU54_08615 [Candidatus Omnitrophica bacterium]|nr:hypothetical protein [Candidatus Omnitrophota bacterium]